MSRSNKARYGTKTKQWKDSVGRSRSQVRSRAKWKKATKNSPKKQILSRVLRGRGKGRPRPREKPTERELVEMGLANNATAEIMQKYMKYPSDPPKAVKGNGLKIFS